VQRQGRTREGEPWCRVRGPARGAPLEDVWASAPSRSDQHLGRDPELSVQAADHIERELAPAGEYLGDAGARPDAWLQGLPVDVELLHPERMAATGSGG
jgi:hypothetical protein